MKPFWKLFWKPVLRLPSRCCDTSSGVTVVGSHAAWDCVMGGWDNSTSEQLALPIVLDQVYLISESSRSGNTLIIPIFGPRDLASVHAYVLLHSVIGLTLPALDGNSLSLLSNCPLWQHLLYMIP
ncbi:hypothetical protein N7501_003073 [Penicillium viridicatum]|nr:hypothetical protein N7501_003073 [Penicillium viridicatum]